MRTTPKLLLLSTVAAFGLVACSSGDEAAEAKPVEQYAATPRLAATYDGGVRVLDAGDLKQVADLPFEGFTRVNDAGDGRHVFVSTTTGFELVDLGVWTDAHGDHGHHYSSEPRKTGIVYEGEKPGHVVLHDGKTALFSDGTGQVRILDSAKIGQEDAVVDEFTVPAHHGVAVAREDGSVVVSKGDEEDRTGLVIRDKDGNTVAENDECPGLHGEAAGADGVLSFGCTDGTLIVKGNEITKVKADADYARIGNQKGSEASPIILGDYKVEQDAEVEHPEQFALIDTQAGAIKVVPTGGWSYSFRSLGRGPAGEVLMLGTDGKLHVFDPVTGTQTKEVPVIGEWTEPEDWQEPMPALYVQGGTAYVNDPAGSKIIAIALDDYRILNESGTDTKSTELAGVTG